MDEIEFHKHYMAIPESQLTTWSSQGATVGSASSYNSVKTALAQHAWPEGMNFNVYLQGSYPNYTNIRGNSDVDIVVQTDSVFYSNLIPTDKQYLGLSIGAFSWTDFREEVLKALKEYYGVGFIDNTHQKCIKILPTQNRLPVDVIPCVEYRRYSQYEEKAKGMTFWTKRNQQIINYPKLHLENGSIKNRNASGHYKPIVRIFKNARERLPGRSQKFASYFLECLLFNLPDSCYMYSRSSSYLELLNQLYSKKISGELSKLVTQNGQDYLCGSNSWQVTEDEVGDFINNLINQWNNW